MCLVPHLLGTWKGLALLGDRPGWQLRWLWYSVTLPPGNLGFERQAAWIKGLGHLWRRAMAAQSLCCRPRPQAPGVGLGRSVRFCSGLRVSFTSAMAGVLGN